MRCSRLLAPVIVAVVGVLSAIGLLMPSPVAQGQDGPAKQPVPSAAAQGKAHKLIKLIFAEEYAKATKSLGERRALAVAILHEGRDSKESLNTYFTALKEAAELAAQAGDAEMAFDIVKEIGETFAIEPVAFKVAVLARACEAASEAAVFVQLAPHTLALLKAAIDRDDFKNASGVAAVANQIAAQAKDGKLAGKVGRQVKMVEALAKQHAALSPHVAKLAKQPMDAEANLAVGSYLSLGKGHWEKGLPHLVLGSNAKLKDVAERDLAGPSKVEDQLALGDAYWDLAEAAADPAKFQLQTRAALWYGEAYSDLTGLNKSKVDKRLEAAGVEMPIIKVPVGVIKTFQGHTKQVQAAAISPDGKFVVSGGDDDDLRYWEAKTGKEIKVFKGHTQQVWSVAISSDGKYILSTGEDLTVRYWDIANGKEIKSFIGHTAIVNRVVFTTDGKRAVSVADDMTVRMWDLENQKELKQFVGHNRPVWGAAISKDGSKLVTSGEDSLAIVWDVKTGMQTQKFGAHQGNVFSVSLSPDGKQCVSSGDDKIVRLWETESGKEVKKFEGHTSTVYSVAMSPNGKRILSASQDRTIRLWDATTGKQIHLFEGHTDDVVCVVFSADGRYCVSASMDRTVKLWGLPK